MDEYIRTRRYAQRSTFEKLIRLLGRASINVYRDLKESKRILGDISGKIIFLGHAPNSREVLVPIAERCGSDAVFVETIETENSYGKRLPHCLIYLLSLILFPKLLVHLSVASESERGLVHSFLRTIFLTYGTDAYWRAFMAIRKPKAIFVANDHSFEARVPLIAALKNSIPVFYIQHAPVTSHFPPLLFDLAFLEGEHSLRCYGVEESDRVLLVGNLKFERVRHLRNNNDTIKTIGIAGSSLLSQEASCCLVSLIRRHFANMEIIFRPHPDAAGEEWQPPEGVGLSNPAKEKTFEFLSRIDLLVGGESGILSEAALMNVYPILFAEGSSDVWTRDSYGYVSRGLCDTAKNDSEVIQILNRQIKRKESVFQRASYYYSNCYQPFAQDPIQEIANIVNMYVAKRQRLTPIE